jgi:hypothetical protein
MNRGKFQIESWDSKQRRFIISTNKRNKDHALIAAEVLRDSKSRNLKKVRILNIEEKETVFYYRRGKSKKAGTFNHKYFFDLDGVIRHLVRGVHPDFNPLTYNDPLPNGYDFCKYIDKNLDILATAPVTPYYDVIRKLPELQIITFQPEKWKPKTIRWIDRHLADQHVSVHFVNSPAEKMQFLTNGHKLVEDYPFFKDYSKIILIDWPYNQNVAAPFMRISDPNKLAEVIL